VGRRMENRPVAFGSLGAVADQTGTDRIAIAAGIRWAGVAWMYIVEASAASGALLHFAAVAGSHYTQWAAAGIADTAAAFEVLAGFDQGEPLAGSQFALAVARQCIEDEEGEARMQTAEG
jgi:hypothetical protein